MSVGIKFATAEDVSLNNGFRNLMLDFGGVSSPQEDILAFDLLVLC